MARTAPHRWTQRNSRRTTNQSDHNRRSFAIKVLHGNIPTMVRQCSWYNEAYPEPEMQLCPRGCGKKEDQRHTLTCTHGLAVKAPTTIELKGRWGPHAVLVAAHHTQALEPTAMMSEQWQLETKEAIEKDNCTRRANPSKHIPGPKEYSQGIRLQLLEKLEFQYDRWKERDKLQIQRKEASAIKPAKRRQIMRRPRLEARSRDSRTAAVPPIPRPWGDGLLSRRQVVLSTIAQELKAITRHCPRILPSPVA
ncbi:hypothetical protein BX070DRAFT_264033 [Coemansia spiralis]|nr:hypothetical protein BX070DRAFT_264033 [Coemansia spiralis]